MSCNTGTRFYLNPNNKLVLSIGAVSSPDTGYDIKFVSVDYDSQSAVKATDFTPFMKDGEPLSLTPKNSPMELTIPGLYLFEKMNQQRADLFINEVKQAPLRGAN